MARDDYDFWLFDLDGTVVDVEQSYPRSVVGEVADRLGTSFSHREVDRIWYGAGGVRAGVLESAGVDPDAFWTTFHEVEDPRARAESTYVYEDAERFLTGVDGPTGLVTHCQSYLTEPLLAYHDIRDWFDTVVCCSEETGWKPDPTPVELAMRDLAVGSGEQSGALAGDNPSDVGAAWNAGLDAVHVERVGADRRGHCVLGDHRIEAFDEL